MLLRFISVLLGAPLILAAAYAGGICFTALLLVVVLLGMREYLLLLRQKLSGFPAACGFAGAVLLLLLVHFGCTAFLFPATLLLLILLFAGMLPDPKRVSPGESALVLWGIIYLGGCGSYFIRLRALPGGIFFTFILLIGVWTNDILAFFVGRRWGRRRLAPRISPRKSIEGFLAGLIGTPLVAVAASFLLPGGPAGLDPGRAVFLGVLIALVATAGDLLESVLKRQAGVKDTGRLIPGHGGILDRFDSLLLAAPFVYYFFLLFHGGI